MISHWKKYFKFSRWHTLAASALLQSFVGVMFTFSIFNVEFKDRMNLTQENLQTIMLMFNIGSGFSLPSGFIYDSLGPRPTLMIGAAIMAMGWSFFWAVTNGYLAQEYESVLILAFLAGNSNTWIDNTAVVTNAKNFPRQRSIVIGILSSLVGLSTTVNTQIYVSFFEPDWISFILFVGTGLPISVLVLTLFVNTATSRTEHRSDPWEGWASRRLFVLGVTIVFLAGFLQVCALVNHNYVLPDSIKQCMTLGVYVFLSVFWLVPFLFRHRHSSTPRPVKHTEVVMEGLGMLANDALRGEGEGEGEGVPKLARRKSTREQEGMTVKQALTDVKFYLLFVILAIANGTGVTTFNWIGIVVQSYGGEPGSQSSYVAVLGVSSCLGRLLVGVIAWKLEGKVNRPWLFLACVASQAVGQFVMAFSSLFTLYLGCALSSLALGAGYSVVSSMLADIFGTKHLGAIMSIIYLASPCGTTFFARFLCTLVYSSHTAAGSTVCLGRDCFQNAFLINSASAAAAAGLTFVLCLLSRPIYARKRKQ